MRAKIVKIVSFLTALKAWLVKFTRAIALELLALHSIPKIALTLAIYA